MEFQPLERLAQSLQARDMAVFPVVHAGVDEHVSVVGERMQRDDFSHMPLRDAAGRVVRVLEREATSGKTGRAYDAAVPLDSEKHVVRADAPLPTVLAKLPRSGFLLVSSKESGWQDRIAGIINHADVVSLPVRLFIYARTMQLEKRVFEAISGMNWKDTEGLADLWNRIDARYKKAGEQRSCRETYLEFRDVMRIGQMRQMIGLRNGDELDLLCTARNFACHATIDAPADNLRPEEIPTEVERCVILVERLLSSCYPDSGSSVESLGFTDGIIPPRRVR